MPYIDTAKVAQMRKAIRQVLPEYKISVRKHHHSTVDVTVLAGPIPDPGSVNVYWYKDHFRPDKLNRPDAIAVIDTILAEIKKVETPRTLVEDGDYGTVPTFYYDVTFGAWDKPYICTDPDAETRLEIKREFDRIATRYVIKCDDCKTTIGYTDSLQVSAAGGQCSNCTVPICGITVLAPDDLIIPCVLPAGHDGYCNTGR